MEVRGIDPLAPRMQSECSTIWATPPLTIKREVKVGVVRGIVRRVVKRVVKRVRIGSENRYNKGNKDNKSNKSNKDNKDRE